MTLEIVCLGLVVERKIEEPRTTGIFRGIVVSEHPIGETTTTGREIGVSYQNTIVVRQGVSVTMTVINLVEVAVHVR